MRDKGSITILILAGLILATFGLGVIGWIEHDLTAGAKRDVSLAVYRAFLAFGGDEIYIPVTSNKLKIVRVLGVLSTISTFFALAYLFAADHLRKWALRRRKGHIVLVGVNDFSLSYAQRLAGSGGAITLIDAPARLENYLPKRIPGLQAYPVDFAQVSDLCAGFGMAPKKVILGAQNSIANLELAQKILRSHPDAPLVIRAEKENVAASLNLWSDDFNKLQVISESAFVARALVTELAPMDLARTRRQDAPHIAVIGVGDTSLAIIEELALRCHAPDLSRLKISTYDLEPKRTMQVLRMERAGLFAAIDLIAPQLLDAKNDLVGRDNPDPLQVAETTMPLTAIIIATGSDEVNSEIALRLRRLQVEEGLYHAPILVRLRGSETVAPTMIKDIGGAIYPFGGPVLRESDMDLHHLQDALGQRLHENWLAEMAVQAPNLEFPAWEQLNATEKRPNRRAALSAIDVLQTLEFVPPLNGGYAQLRTDAAALRPVLADTARIEAMSKNEHARWVAERFCEGWKQSPDGIRDNRRKLHNLMVPYGELPKGQREEIKDRNNIRAILIDTIERNEKHPNRPKWRRRVRIGIMGPLVVSNEMEASVRLVAAKWLDENMAELGGWRLEIVTPNAPGFDRVAAKILLEEWFKATGQPADLLRFEVGNADLLDTRAEAHLASKTGQSSADIRTECTRQTKALAKAKVGLQRRFDATPPEMLAEGFLKAAEMAAQDIAHLSDVFLVALPEEGACMTRRVIDGFRGEVLVA